MKNSKYTKGKKSGDKKTRDVSFIVTEPEELMKFLIVQMPHKNRNNIKMILKKKQVLVDGKSVTQFNHPLKPGQKVQLSTAPAPVGKTMKGISVVFEDKDLIVVNKNAGLLSMATDKEKRDTVYSRLSQYVKTENENNKIFIVHRLDRETSGLMMFAKSQEMKRLLQETWKETIVDRSYLALIEGQLDKTEGTVSSYLFESKVFIVYSTQDPEKGKPAVTHYKTKKSNEEYSLLKVNLETGLKNQIRVHMQDLKHPIVGDKKYGSNANPIGRLGLHAWVLSFTHPITKKKVRFETSVPGSFLKVFKQQ